MRRAIVHGLLHRARGLRDFALDTEASTRSAALIRIGLALTMWTRWGHELLLLRHLADGLWPMCIAFFVSSSLSLIGLWTRYAVPCAGLSALYLVYYLGHTLGHEAYTHHHTTLLAWAMVWLAFVPSGRSYSVDRWLLLRKAECAGAPVPEEKGNVWGLRLLSLQVASLYLWTAIAKCDAGFLSGSRLAHYTMRFYTGSSVIDEGLSGQAFMLAAWATVALEFALAIGLFVAKSRAWLVVLGLLLHGTFYVLLDVSTFTVTMFVLYLSFFDPDGVHRVIDRMHGVATRVKHQIGGEAEACAAGTTEAAQYDSADFQSGFRARSAPALASQQSSGDRDSSTEPRERSSASPC